MRRNSAALKFLHLTVYSSLALINWAQNVSLNVEMSICFSCVISSCEAFSTDMLLESAKGERKNECVDETMKGFIVFALLILFPSPDKKCVPFSIPFN